MTKRIIFGEGIEFLARDGLAPHPAVWEDGLRTDAGRGTIEWWYFDAHLDDGSTAVMIYLTKPIVSRSGPLAPSLQLTITPPDGHKLSALPVYPASQFGAAKDCCDVRIGPNRVRGDLHRYEIHAEAEGLAADLILTGVVPPWRPGSGKQFFEESLTRYFGWLPPVSYGTVEGTLGYDGRTLHVMGTGYHDHFWGNVGLDEVYSHWYWGRGHVGDYTVVFTEITASAQYGMVKQPIFMLAKGDQILTTDGRPLKLESGDEQTHPSGKTYPRRLDLHWQKEQATVGLALREPQMIEATSLLTFLPSWQRPLARLFANPYYFRFTSRLDLTVNLPEAKATESGSALYELMILH